MAASWAYTKCLVTEYWLEIEKKKLIKQINGKGNSSASASIFDLVPFKFSLEDLPLTEIRRANCASKRSKDFGNLAKKFIL